MKRTMTVLEKFIKKSTLFRYGFNLSPVYRRSTGRVYFVSDDLLTVKVRIPLTYKNRNYMGTMFGGAMASATDPFYMIQLITLLGGEYVVWDKSASIKFKRPGNKTLYAEFNLSHEFLDDVKEDVQLHKETLRKLIVNLRDKDEVVYAEVERVIYITSKRHFKTKRRSSNRTKK